MAMLEGVAELDLEQLNLLTQVWVEQEYHHSKHAEIGPTFSTSRSYGKNIGLRWSSAPRLCLHVHLDAKDLFPQGVAGDHLFRQVNLPA